MADDVVFPWSLVNGDYTMTSGVPLYYQVKASADRVFDVARFFTDKTTAMTSFHVSVFRPSTANNLAKVMHLGNVKAQLGTTYNLQTIMLTEPLDAAAGEIFFVGLLSVGGTPPKLYRSGDYYGYQIGGSSVIASQDLTLGQIPEYHQITAVSTATGKTSFADTEAISGTASTNAGARIWGALGNLITTVQRPPWFFVDSLNRGNATDLLSPWGGNPSVPRFAIYNETASPQPDATYGAYNYVIPSARSDDHYAQVRLGADMDSALGNDIDLYVGVRSGRGVSGPAVKLHLNPVDGTFRVVNVTRAYDNNGLTQRAAAPEALVFASGDTVKIVASQTIYTAFHNDDPIVSWVDSGVIHPVNVDQRWVDITAGQTLLGSMQVIDNVEAGDAVGGVQLVALTGIASTAVVGSHLFQSNVSLALPTSTVALTGNALTRYSGVGLALPASTRVLTGNVLTLSNPAPQAPEINTPRTNVAVPSNALGVWVTLRGAGGGGGGGYENSNTAYALYGGGGGGGGAVIKRTFIPRSALGATYTVQQGAGGPGGPPATDGSPGGRSRFVSGPIDWSAYGGGGGNNGWHSALPADVAGGTVGYSGYTPSGWTDGGVGKGYGDGPNVTDTSAGGGSGGWVDTSDAVGAGSTGGASSYAAGGAGDNGNGDDGGNSANDVLGGGGGGAGGAGWTNGNFAGGDGGNYGGGGGGAGATRTGANNSGGAGAPGYTRLEWILS